MERQERHGPRAVGLTLIALGKLIKVVLLLSAGVAAVFMAHDPPHSLLHWAHAVGVDAGNRWVHLLISKASGLSTHQLRALGVGSFVYAAIFTVEGAGLWLQKHWAEYLTLVVTLSFVPLEVYEIAHRISPVKVVMLGLNLVAIAYLIARLLARRAPARLDNASR